MRAIDRISTVTADYIRDMILVKGKSDQEVVDFIHKEVGIQKELILEVCVTIRDAAKKVETLTEEELKKQKEEALKAEIAAKLAAQKAGEV